MSSTNSEQFLWVVVVQLYVEGWDLRQTEFRKITGTVPLIMAYSEVLEKEARDSKCTWDENVSTRDYVYQVCSYDGCLELYDMTEGSGIFGTHHRFIGNYEAKNCYFLPATDELVVSSIDGIWVFDAAAMKSKKLLNNEKDIS